MPETAKTSNIREVEVHRFPVCHTKSSALNVNGSGHSAHVTVQILPCGLPGGRCRFRSPRSSPQGSVERLT